MPSGATGRLLLEPLATSCWFHYISIAAFVLARSHVPFFILPYFSVSFQNQYLLILLWLSLTYILKDLFILLKDVVMWRERVDGVRGTLAPGTSPRSLMWVTQAQALEASSANFPGT